MRDASRLALRQAEGGGLRTVLTVAAVSLHLVGANTVYGLDGLLASARAKSAGAESGDCTVSGNARLSVSVSSLELAIALARGLRQRHVILRARRKPPVQLRTRQVEEIHRRDPLRAQHARLGL